MKWHSPNGVAREWDFLNPKTPHPKPLISLAPHFFLKLCSSLSPSLHICTRNSVLNEHRSLESENGRQLILLRQWASFRRACSWPVLPVTLFIALYFQQLRPLHHRGSVLSWLRFLHSTNCSLQFFPDFLTFFC